MKFMSNVTVNTDQVLAMFDELDSRRRRQVYRSTLNTSANILIRRSKQNLRRTVSGSNKKSPKTGKTLESGIKKRIKITNEGFTSAEAKVSILGDFRLKFFEMGTKNRTTKGHKKGHKYWSRGWGRGRIYWIRGGKGGFRGRIDASRFFTEAKRDTEIKIFAEIDSTFSKHIQRINDRFKNGTTNR